MRRLHLRSKNLTQIKYLWGAKLRRGFHTFSMQNRARTRLCCGQLLLKTQFIIISLIAARLIGSINSLLALLLLHQKATKFVEFFLRVSLERWEKFGEAFFSSDDERNKTRARSFIRWFYFICGDGKLKEYTFRFKLNFNRMVNGYQFQMTRRLAFCGERKSFNICSPPSLRFLFMMSKTCTRTRILMIWINALALSPPPTAPPHPTGLAVENKMFLLSQLFISIIVVCVYLW